MVRLVKLWSILVALFMVYFRSAVIRYNDARYATQELIYMDMSGDSCLCLFIYENFYICILVVNQNTDKDPCISDLAGIRIDDMSRSTCPIDLDQFHWLSGDMHGGTPFLFILLDVIAEMRIHKRVPDRPTAFFEVFNSQKLFGDIVFLQFLSDILVVRHPF